MGCDVIRIMPHHDVSAIFLTHLKCAQNVKFVVASTRLLPALLGGGGGSSRLICRCSQVEQCTAKIEEFKAYKKHYNAVADKYKASQEGLNTLSNELNQISEVLEVWWRGPPHP